MKMSAKSSFLITLALAAILGSCLLLTAGYAAASAVKSGTGGVSTPAGKTAVVYFTYAENIGDTSSMTPDALTGASLHEPTQNSIDNTALMVREIQQKFPADIYPIVVQNPYQPAFDDMKIRARREVEGRQKIALKSPVPDFAAYDTVFIGSPIWWYTAPAPVRTFLEAADLKGKTIVPFGIHRGSGLKPFIEVLKGTQPEARISAAFTVSAPTPNAEVRAKFGEFLNSVTKSLTKQALAAPGT